MPELKNKKHEVFCQEYLIDLNATQAYIRAGYSARSAKTLGPQLLGNLGVRARMDELLAIRSARTGVTADRVVRELARIAFLDPTRLANMNDASLDEYASEDDRACIASVKVKSGDSFTEREIKFADKLKALEQLGKHLGMFQDNINLNVELPRIVDDIGGDTIE